MDTLMQGDVSKDFVEDTCGYDSFMNRFDRLVTAGIALILSGIGTMGFLMGLGMDEDIAPVFFFIFLIVGVIILVVWECSIPILRKSTRTSKISIRRRKKSRLTGNLR